MNLVYTDRTARALVVWSVIYAATAPLVFFGTMALLYKSESVIGLSLAMIAWGLALAMGVRLLGRRRNATD